MFLEGFGIEPHEARLVHVGQKHGLVLAGGIFPVGIMLPVLAWLMGEVTHFFMQTKIKADTLAILWFSLIRESFHCGCSLFDMEDAHF
jgi:hypothetical protein